MRSPDFSIHADRPIRLKAAIFAGSNTLQVTEQREHDLTLAPVTSIYNAVSVGHGATLRRAVEAFNAIMAEADVPAAWPPIAPLTPFAAAILGAETTIAAE